VSGAALIHRSIITIWLGLVLWFYLWTASSSGNPFTFGTSRVSTYRATRIDTVDYYNMLTDAFLRGRLSLVQEPSKELLNLPDPYDPSLNEGLRMHDASLYNGKYYAYWGLTPALVLFLPFRVIFHRDMPDNLAVALFCFGGLLWSVLLLNVLTKTYFPETPLWMRFAAVSCLSLSNVAPYILRRPAVYEVAIASGYFFLFGGLFWLLSAVLKERRARLWRFSLGSLFLGLAVGSRPHYVFAGVLLPLLWWKCVKEQYGFRMKHALKALLFLMMPFALCLALLGLYNYARFDSWTEFGIRYVLMSRKLHDDQVFHANRILPNLFFYFLAPARLSVEFPFFRLAPSYPWALPEGFLGPEPVAGILTNIPFLDILLLSPLYLLWRPQPPRPYLNWVVACFIVLALALAAFVSALSATMRYVMDFVSLLLAAAILLWFYLYQQLQDHRIARCLLGVISTLLIGYGSFFNVAISMTGYYDLLRSRNPQAYDSIRKLFVPLERLIAGYSPTPSVPSAPRSPTPRPAGSSLSSPMVSLTALVQKPLPVISEDSQSPPGEN
jgi:hypothetical protein